MDTDDLTTKTYKSHIR